VQLFIITNIYVKPTKVGFFIESFMYYQGVKKTIVVRSIEKKRSQFGDMHPLLERIFLARGVTSEAELERTLLKLPSPWLLSGMDGMVAHLITAINEQQRISIVADFDADGATSCAVAIKGLQLLGADQVLFAVPNRFEYGYGLTP
jgi:single-stranded-DNA-specific exonuclease